MLDDLGSSKTYKHYPNGWAMAFNAPFKMWKRYEFNGGSCDPCIISRPKAITAQGEIRDQYHHAIDIVPTILDCLGVESPEVIKGHVQSNFDGISMRYSFKDAEAPGHRKTQFYSRLGSRAIWHEGWKAVTTHPTLSGWSQFNDDTWELYHVEVDPAELHDLAGKHPEKVRELVNLWFSQAGANGAFPLDDRSAVEILNTPRPQLTSPRNRYRYLPGVSGVPEAQSVNRNYIGVLEQRIVANEHVPPGEDLLLSASFVKDGEDPPGVSTGILTLFHGEAKVGEGRIKTQPSMFGISGTDLTVGRSTSRVTDHNPGEPPWRFTGGTIKLVAVDVSGEPYVDLERAAAAMIARE